MVLAILFSPHNNMTQPEILPEESISQHSSQSSVVVVAPQTIEKPKPAGKKSAWYWNFFHAPENTDMTDQYLKCYYCSSRLKYNPKGGGNLKSHAEHSHKQLAEDFKRQAASDISSNINII